MDFFTKPSGSHRNLHLPNETPCFKIVGILKKSKLFPFESAYVLCVTKLENLILTLSASWIVVTLLSISCKQEPIRCFITWPLQWSRSVGAQQNYFPNANTVSLWQPLSGHREPQAHQLTIRNIIILEEVREINQFW